MTHNEKPDVRDLAAIGALVAGGFFLTLVAWSAFAPLSTGATMPGRLVTIEARTAVEYLEGGIVRTVHVQNGQTVEAGDPLVSMDTVTSRAQLEGVEAKLFALRARKLRLAAERSGTPPQFDQLQGYNRYSAIAALEQAQYRDRATLLREERDTRAAAVQAEENVLQKLTARPEKTKGQIDLLTEEIAAVRGLFERGYAAKPRLLALERAKEQLAAQLLAEESQIDSQIARVREAKLARDKTELDWQNSLAAALTEVEVEISSTQGSRQIIDDALERTLVRAPRTGVVLDMRVKTSGEIVAPGSALLDIVPERTGLEVLARLSAADAAKIQPGLPARIMITAMKDRSAKALEGAVRFVAADTIRDPRTGEDYYELRIDILEKDMESLQPGMPAEVRVETARQPVLAYLIAPLTQGLARSFTEP